MWEEKSPYHHPWLEACIISLWWAIYSDRQRLYFPPSVTFIDMYLIKVIRSHIKLIPQTEYASEVFLNDLMVWFLLEAPLGEGHGTPLPVLLPGKSHGWRSCVGCSPWGHEELDTTEQLHFHFSLSCIGEGNGNPLQSSCLENPRDRGAWWAAIYGVTQSRTRLKRFSSSSSSSSTSGVNSYWWF